MNSTNQRWYWLAAGVLALGINGYYQDGGLQGLHRLAERTTMALAETRGQAGGIATLAETTLAEHTPTCERQARSQVAMNMPVMCSRQQAHLAHVQKQLARMQAARVQAQLAALQEVTAGREIDRARVEFQNGRLEVLSGRTRVRVAVPPLPRLEVNVPQGPLVEVTPN